MDWIRRNLLVMLIAVLIVTQLGLWWAMVSLHTTLDQYACGTRTLPCKVVVMPDR